MTHLEAYIEGLAWETGMRIPAQKVTEATYKDAEARKHEENLLAEVEADHAFDKAHEEGDFDIDYEIEEIFWEDLGKD